MLKADFRLMVERPWKIRYTATEENTSKWKNVAKAQKNTMEALISISKTEKNKVEKHCKSLPKQQQKIPSQNTVFWKTLKWQNSCKSAKLTVNG